jgi:DNA-binding transcriptional regulator YbjK
MQAADTRPKRATQPRPDALPRRAEPDARRQSLIEAAMRVLARAGANGASVRAIAQEAGVSPGLVGHYFTGIDALIAETYTHVDAMVTRALDAAVAAAPPLPRARLEAFVTASFTAPIAQPALLATWIAFWSLVTSQPQIARQHDEQYAGYRAGSKVCCAKRAWRKRTCAMRRLR